MKMPFIRADNTGFCIDVPHPLKPTFEIPVRLEYIPSYEEEPFPNREWRETHLFRLVKFADDAGVRYIYIESRKYG